MNDPETPDDLVTSHAVQRTRSMARDLLHATSPFDPMPHDEDPGDGVLRGGLHYLERLRAVVPDAAAAIANTLRTVEPEAAALEPQHPADVLELAHPPAYQQLLRQVMRYDETDAHVVAAAAGELARAWEHTLMASRHHLTRGGVEGHLEDLDRELNERAEEADALLERTRSLTYLSAGGAQRFSDCYVDVARELVGELLTEGNEVHGRIVTGLPKGSELMGAGWVPEQTGTLRLWFRREGIEHASTPGAPCEAVLCSVEQTHRPTFGLSRSSNPDLFRLVAEWSARAREELGQDGAPMNGDQLLDDLDATLRGWPHV